MAEFAPLVLPTEVASLGLPDDALEELDVCHECGQLAPAGPVSLGAAGGGAPGLVRNRGHKVAQGAGAAGFERGCGAWRRVAVYR